MKGIIFNLAQDVITSSYGEDAWDTILDAAELDGAYTSLGSYPDSEFIAIAEAAATSLDLSVDEVVRNFGTSAMPLLAGFYPHFFTGHDTTRGFLLTLNDVIHREVVKIYPGAVTPTFEFDDSSDEELQITYVSERKLCSLAEGFILGAATHFNEQVTLAQTSCMHRGDDHCLLTCSFVPA